MFINLKQLKDYLRVKGAKRLEVVHKQSGDKYYLAYQFYINSNGLCYLSFINKETFEIERLDEDLDNGEFKKILKNWSIYEIFTNPGTVGQKVRYAGESHGFLTKGKKYTITRLVNGSSAVIFDDLNEPIVIDTKLSHWYS